jgi:hypothetical protein
METGQNQSWTGTNAGMAWATHASSARRNGIEVEVLFFVPTGETAEVWQVTVRNHSKTTRSIQLFSFVEFCFFEALNDMTNYQRTYSIGEVEVEGSAIYHKPNTASGVTTTRCSPARGRSADSTRAATPSSVCTTASTNREGGARRARRQQFRPRLEPHRIAPGRRDPGPRHRGTFRLYPGLCGSGRVAQVLVAPGVS